MRKSKELTDPNSCLNKALPEEPLFVLLGRDPVAPELIKMWVKLRIEKGLNRPTDLQIQGALRAANIMARERPMDHAYVWGPRPSPTVSDPDAPEDLFHPT